MLVLVHPLTHQTVSIQSTKSKSIAPQAINSILSDYMSRNFYTIDVVAFESRSISSEAIIESISRNINYSNAIQVSTIGDRHNPWKFRLNTSSVLVFDSPRSFKRIATKIIWQTDPKVRYKHIVYVITMTIDDLRSMTFEDGFSIDCVNFLVDENENSIDLAQNVMFSARACREIRWAVFNQFDKSINRWSHSDFYPNKYRNLHGCSLEVAVKHIGSQAIPWFTVRDLG